MEARAAAESREQIVKASMDRFCEDRTLSIEGLLRNAIDDAVAQAVKERDETIAALEMQLAAPVYEEIARQQERLDAHAEIVAEAVAAERERIAKIAISYQPAEQRIERIIAALRAPEEAS